MHVTTVATKTRLKLIKQSSAESLSSSGLFPGREVIGGEEQDSETGTRKVTNLSIEQILSEDFGLTSFIDVLFEDPRLRRLRRCSLVCFYRLSRPLLLLLFLLLFFLSVPRISDVAKP